MGTSSSVSVAVLVTNLVLTACGGGGGGGDLPRADAGDLPADVACAARACGDCTRSGVCGWCAAADGTGACAPGTASGPDDGTACADGTWTWEPAECRAAPPYCTNDAAPGLVGVAEYERTETLTAYRVEYLSDGLRVLGEICVPAGAGPFPIALYNHGGFDGLGADVGANGQCRALAEQGFVTVASQYRGETDEGFGTSEGAVELCLGEAVDSLNLLRIAQFRCDVDPTRVVVFGLSHGGCITLQTLRLAGTTFRGAVALYPFADAVSVYHAVDRARSSLDLVKRAIGLYFYPRILAWAGKPSSNPEGYALRSPVLFADTIVRSGVPVLLIHGLADPVLSYVQTCDLRDALSAEGLAIETLHLGSLDGPPTAIHPAGCAEAPLGDALPLLDEELEGQSFAIFVDKFGHDPTAGAVGSLLYRYLAVHGQ